MKQKYRINLYHWNYVGGMQHIFSIKYTIKRNQDIKRDFKKCNHIIHLLKANDKKHKKVQR